MLSKRWMTVLGVLFLAGMCRLATAGEAAGKAEKGEAGAKAEGRQGRGGRGNFDPEQMRQRMIDNYKEQLGMTDEEVKAIMPKIEKVQQLQRDSRSGGFPFGFGGPGGGPGGFGGRGGDRGGRGGDRQGDQPQSAVAKATSDLRTAVQDKAASADDISKKLTALRQAREKAKSDVAAAQKDLRELLTQKQEAALVLMGILE